MKWVAKALQVLVALMFVGAGMFKVTSSKSVIHEYFTEPLGYSEWFIYFIGACELLGAIGLVVGLWKSRIGYAAQAGLVIIIVGAVVSNISAGLLSDSLSAGINLVLLVLLFVIQRMLYRSSKTAIQA